MGNGITAAALVVLGMAASSSATLAPASNGTLATSGANTTAAECKTAPASRFYENVHDNCESYMTPIQTCPGTPSSADQLFTLSDGVSRCTLQQFRSTFPCAKDKKFALGDSSPPADPSSVNSSPSCRYPDYQPIFEEASSYFMNHVSCCGKSPYTSEYLFNYTGNGEKGGADSSVPLEVIQKTPVQYQRCALQKDFDSVRSCVVSTIAKLRWLSPGMFIWGGQAACEGVDSLLIATAFTMLIELLLMLADFWWYRFKGEKPTFSWVKMWWSLVAAFGEPILKAYLLYRRSFDASMFTLLRIFLLTPRIAPVIGMISPFVIGKSWGVQVLTADTLLTIVGLYSPFITFVGMSVSVTGAEQEPGVPGNLWLVYVGSLMAAVPGLGVAALYMLSGALMWVCFIIGCLCKSGRPFSWGFTILGFWLALIFMFVISPLFAIWEVGWKLFRNDRKNEFPPLMWFESSLCSDYWVAKVLRTVGYWLWCLIQFAVFVGRWMILANILPAAGEAFCPVGVKEVAAEGALFALATALCSMGLRIAGLTY